MKIYTSYFGNFRTLKQNNVLMVGVSRYPPQHFQGQTMYELAPLSNMLNLSEPEYDKQFAEKILSKISQKQIIEKIEKIAIDNNVDSIALCCFEKEQTECHRYNVACWLNQKGYDVQEFKIEYKKKPKLQLSLF